ncbi:MAG: AAA family ATPase [Proteobacteria bacterium]|nr:AAA family ATPase [Pseudomonadota bacterium]
MISPAELICSRRVVVCVGTGGVGKTTVAASLALEGARRGRRALVLTIDPARRLADALGVDALGNRPSELAAERRDSLGIHGEGRLFALMLDMKRTFDDLVERFAENADARERIFGNRIYQHVSDALAGSAEYAAMEKVYELCESGDFDLVVVDTPPSQHALDFLDAPQRLLEFLDSRLVHVLLHPAFAAGRFGFRLFHRTAQRAIQLIEKVSGVSFLEDVSEFLLAFEGMSEGFRARATRVRQLMTGPETGFVLVAGASAGAVRGAVDVLDHLDESGVPLVGVVVNRIRLWPPGEAGALPAALSEDGDAAADTALLAQALVANGLEPARADEAARAAVEVAKGYASLVRLDARCTAELRFRALQDGRFFCRVPEFPRDVHDLDGLMRIGGFLVDDERRRTADGSSAAPVPD